MKLLWIFLVFLIQSEFGDCWKCQFYNWDDYTCKIKSTSNVEEQHDAGEIDDYVNRIWFEGKHSENLTAQNFGPLCERFRNADEIEFLAIKSVSEDSFQRCINLKKITIVYSEVEEVPENLFSNLPKLTFIGLTWNNKLKLLPEKIFSSQKNLEKLDLRSNQISCLPPNIFDSLTMLKTLWLYSNRIQSLDPKWFENLHSLEALDLSWNNLQDLPKSVFKNLKKLENLYLSFNQLTTIHSDSFPNQGNLKILNLRDNKISSIDEKILDLTNLNEVYIKGNICSKEDIGSRNELKEKLQKCFDNYQPRVDPMLIKCGTLTGLLPRIHRGDLTAPNEYPWNAVLVTNEGQFFCGGTVVSSKHVVTAAHCIVAKRVSKHNFNKCDFYVQLGVHNFTKEWKEGRNGMAVKSIFIHPDWNVDVETYEADIAVLEMLNEINFNQFVRPICIPDVDSPVASATRGTAVGFGITENGTISDIARKLQIPIYSYKNCTKHSPDHRDLAGPRSFCGGYADCSGVCTGDSGGRVYVSHGKAYYLRGVVSSSLLSTSLQCDVDRVAVFTDVSKFYGWIKSGGLDEHAYNRNLG